MPAHTGNHPYADRAALTRLLLLIATIVQHPGIGGADSLGSATDQPLSIVKTQMQSLASQLGLSLPNYSIHTLRKDLLTLRQHGILQSHPYRHGYYLGTGIMTWEELRLALNALHSQADHQRDALVSRAYYAIRQRVGPLTPNDSMFYPLRTYINHPVTHTDPEMMIQQGDYRRTLFDQLGQIESAILQGQGVELYRQRHGHSRERPNYLRVYPLQLVYSDLAWYLLCEECSNGYLRFRRLDRFSDHCQPLENRQRSLEAQKASLNTAHHLRRQGWGLYLGDPQQQQLERQGKVEFVVVAARFFGKAIPFIQEGDRRHTQQTIIPGEVDQAGNLLYVDYQVPLPPRSFQEFSYWVNKHLDAAQIIQPPDLAAKHYQAAQALVRRYETSRTTRL